MINKLIPARLRGRTDEITIYAGPCSVESEEQFDEVARAVSADLGLTMDSRQTFKPHPRIPTLSKDWEEGLKIMKGW